jgi:hypothetical protein
VLANPAVLFQSAPLPITVLVLLFPPPRHTVIPLMSASAATSRSAQGVRVPIPIFPVSSSK